MAAHVAAGDPAPNREPAPIGVTSGVMPSTSRARRTRWALGDGVPVAAEVGPGERRPVEVAAPAAEHPQERVGAAEPLADEELPVAELAVEPVERLRRGGRWPRRARRLGARRVGVALRVDPLVEVGRRRVGEVHEPAVPVASLVAEPIGGARPPSGNRSARCITIAADSVSVNPPSRNAGTRRWGLAARKPGGPARSASTTHELVRHPELVEADVRGEARRARYGRRG